MPTYDYICTACNHAWELEQRISEDPIDTCPKCTKKAAKRQISGGNGFILKGGGWYADLYSSPKPQTSSPASESKADTSSSNSESA